MPAANLAQIKQMMQTLRSVANPAAMLQSMAAQNPQLQTALRIVQESGGDPQRAFYALARQKGVDPQQILDMLR